MAFYIGVYAYAIIVHTRADQLLPQLLMEQFDTLSIQCRHIKHILGHKRNAVYKTYIVYEGISPISRKRFATVWALFLGL